MKQEQIPGTGPERVVATAPPFDPVTAPDPRPDATKLDLRRAPRRPREA